MNDVKIIEDLEVARETAMLNADLATLDKLLSDDLVYIHGNSDLDSKESYLAALERGAFRYISIDRADRHIASIGTEAALVTASVTLGVTFAEGREIMVRGRTVAIWQCRAGQWQLRYYQSTPLPAP